MIFTEQHQQMRATLRRFVEEEINPYCDEWEEAEIFPAHALFKKLGDLGLLGITKPEEYGGLALDYSYALVFGEELGWANAGGIPMAIGVQTDMATPALAKFGSDALRREFLAPAISGDMVACVGVTEPSAGSDVANIRTQARKDGGDYIINGSKTFITNSTQADWICLLVNTSDGPIHSNKSLVVVPMKTKGVSVAKKLKKLGMWSSDTAELHFDDVRVPMSNRIGEEGQGFSYQMIQFQEERLFGAVSGVLGMQRAIENTIEYTRERHAFGKPLIENQVIHFRLSELMTEVEALRALIYHAGERYVAGDDVTMLASMAKLKSGRLSRELYDACLQYWGGNGYMWESSISRGYRDSRLTAIGGGADEVMLSIISKKLGILPGKKRS